MLYSKLPLLMASGAIFVLCGCTGSLVVTDEKGTPLAGVPVASNEVWVEEGLYTKLAKGGDCDARTPFTKVVTLGTGPKIYVKPEGSLLAKTSFSMKLNSDGSLTQIDFNTDSNLPDTLNATTSLLKALPSLGVGLARAPTSSDKPACDSGEQVTKLTRFNEWLRSHD